MVLVAAVNAHDPIGLPGRDSGIEVSKLLQFVDLFQGRQVVAVPDPEAASETEPCRQ